MRFLFDPQDRHSFYLMPQKDVRQVCLPRKTLYCASWDSMLAKEGRLFFSLCSELTTSQYAMLAEYDYETNTVKEHFRAADVLLPQEDYIRDSKFHTSMAQRRDGTLIMATHTTDKSPRHPAWMPEAFIASPWTGFPGSSLISYDPQTGKAELLGIPAPRESVYGAAYDPKHDNYYMLGFLRGHLYRYSGKENRSYDMGQATERCTYKLHRGPDGNIYFTTRSGYLRRINVDGCYVEDLKVQLPNSSAAAKLPRSYLCAAVNGPDGKLYMAGQFHDEISRFDPATGCLEVMGRFMEQDVFMEGYPNNAYIGAMDFDSHGTLWYLVNCLRRDRKEDFKPPCFLMRWDILGGGKPQVVGIAGTPERALTTSVGLFIDKEKDLLYMVSTNHADEGPDITAVPLASMRSAMDSPRELCQDIYIWAGNKDYTAHSDNLDGTWKIMDANPAAAKFQTVVPVRLWSLFDHPISRDCAVKALRWEGDTLYGLCGQETQYIFAIQDNTLQTIFTAAEDPARMGWLLEVAPVTTTAQAPWLPGRQYRGQFQWELPWHDGGTVAITRDSLVCRVKNGKAFSLGPVCVDGPVRGVCTNKTGSVLYGVAGNDKDLGVFFTYDDAYGLRLGGRIVTDGWEYGAAASCQLDALALHPDEQVIAIGAGDRLGTVYLCTL